MVKITNTLDQPLVINLGPARVLHLLASGTAVLEDEDFQTAEIQGLKAQGALETVEFARKERRAQRRQDESTAKRKES